MQPGPDALRAVGGALAVILLAALGTLALQLPADDPDSPSVVAVWTPGGLPEGFGAAVAELEGVAAASIVRGDLVGLEGSWDRDGIPVDQPPAGHAFPLDALAVDPAHHAAVLRRDPDPFAALAPGTALLGARSAALRGLGEGATLALSGGERVTVAGVVDDALVGSAEVVLRAPSQAAPTERFVLVAHTGDRADLEDQVRRLADGVPVAVRAQGETRDLRPGGSLLPQVVLKERFGEFAFRPAQGRGIGIEQRWADEHIRVARVPLLGEVACHRSVLPALEGALAELQAASLGGTVDPAQYAGCFVPRRISPGAALSRHAWGAAIDINAVDNPFGAPPEQDPRLVDTMERWGFTWGGDWPVPDGMHFEYVGR